MNRLQRELCRLYAPAAATDPDAAPDEARLVDAGGQVRAMVLELARPADWAALSRVWNGVQVDLDLPAPAIAVSGTDAYQLWFSLAAPLPAPQAHAFLDLLRRRYLGDIAPQRMALFPQVDAVSTLPVQHARRVPAPQADSGLWSAFVASDLAPVFAEEPWLDGPPNPEGQSNLLARLDSIAAAAFQQALDRLVPVPVVDPTPPAPGPAQASVAKVDLPDPRSATTGAWPDPAHFLLAVMNDDSVALALRIQAAAALLPYFDPARRP